jgi:type II secretory pathway pseudopilin PulG
MTLAELLISMAIVSIVLVTLVPLYGSSFRAYSQGANEVRLQERARMLVQRLSTELRCAVQRDNEHPAVETPAVGESGQNLVFTRPDAAFEDFDPRNPVYRRWQIRFDENIGRVIEEKRNDLDNAWVFVRNLGTSLENPDGLEALHLSGVTFEHVRSSAVRIVISLTGEVENGSGRRNDERFSLATEISLPFYALSH